MNERIRELAKKVDPELAKETIYCTSNDLEKFAELVIQECLTVVKLAHSEGNEDAYSYDDALDHAEYNIKQHFGVEE